MWLIKLRFLSVLTAAVMLIAGAGASAADLFPSATNDVNQPLALSVIVKQHSATEGISLRAEIKNTSDAPRSIRVCPEMLMCCVVDLHLMVGYDDTGMGLLDVCNKKTDVVMHEVFLPVGATFSFDLKIPIVRLPKAANTPGKKLSILTCYADESTNVIHSNTVSCEL